MTLDFSSNIDQVLENIRKRSMVKPVYQVRITNNVSYASAVENGYTRTMLWAEMSKEQRYAIIMAAKNKKGARKSKAKVLSFEGGFTITMPPVGMIAKSIRPIKKFGISAIEGRDASLGPLFDHAFAQRLVKELGFYAQAEIVSRTPVDQGVLRLGWEVNFD